MRAFTQHTGLVAAMDRSNVDTDQIIPKQFLKRIERTGFGAFLFFDWRFLEDGTPNPEFELNCPDLEGASILLARQNFGCGSSREHAPGHSMITVFGSLLHRALQTFFTTIASRMDCFRLCWMQR